MVPVLPTHERQNTHKSGAAAVFDLNILIVPLHTSPTDASRQSVGDGDSTCSGTSCGNECSSVSGQPGCDN
jgi:hypothetical protein